MNRILTFLNHELREMLPPTIFFLVAFHIMALLRGLIVEDYGISIGSSASATVGALIVGKAILLADALPLLHWCSGRRLVWNLLWRVFLYTGVALVLQLAEELIPLVSKYHSLGTACAHLLEEVRWHRFWASHLVLILFLASYTVARAVIDGVGSQVLISLFCSPAAASAKAR